MDYQAEQEQELEILTSIYDEHEFERTINSLIGPLTPQKYLRSNIEFESFPTPTNLILVPTSTTPTNSSTILSACHSPTNISRDHPFTLPVPHTHLPSKYNPQRTPRRNSRKTRRCGRRKSRHGNDIHPRQYPQRNIRRTSRLP